MKSQCFVLNSWNLMKYIYYSVPTPGLPELSLKGCPDLPERHVVPVV
jgi:hypothetical protein